VNVLLPIFCVVKTLRNAFPAIPATYLPEGVRRGITNVEYASIEFTLSVAIPVTYATLTV
jgi:hypothetical protein